MNAVSTTLLICDSGQAHSEACKSPGLSVGFIQFNSRLLVLSASLASVVDVGVFD